MECIFFNIKKLISWKRKLFYKVKLFSYAPIQNAVNYRTVGNAEVKAEVLIATHTTSPRVLIPCYCWSAFWGYVSKRNCLEKHFCCYGYCYSSDILAFGCDHRNLQVLSVTLTLNEVLFVCNKQQIVNIIARMSSHLSSVLIIIGIHSGIQMNTSSFHL